MATTTRRERTAPPIRKLSERPKRIRPLIYSEPGGGKSVLVGSTAEIAPTLVLNADGPDGPESMRAMGYDPDIWDIKSYKDLDEAFDFSRRAKHGYEWIWLDGITLFMELGLDDILTQVVKGKPHRSVYKPDKPEYGENQQHISRWIRHMKQLPLNFGITAHVMRIADEDGEVMYLPAIPGTQGALSSKMCGHFSIVGRLHVVRQKGEDRKVHTQRRLTTQFDGKHYARDRYNATLPYVAAPTMAKVVDLIASNSRKSTTSRRTRSDQDQVRRNRKRPR